MSLFRLTCRSTFRRTFCTTRSLLSDASATKPSVVSSLQTELKAALRSKDKPRLNALRALMAEITNASKTTKPIDNDASLFTLLSKQIKASQTAVEEFEKAKRDDLVEKERSTLNVFEDLSGKIDKVGESEIREIVTEVANAGAKNVGMAMGKTMGKLSGRPVDSELVKKIVEEVVGGSA